MEAAARCNIGACRMVNQDRVFSSQEAVGSLPNLYIVADGMGRSEEHLRKPWISVYSS